MSKKEFIDELRIKLSKLNNIDIEESLRFYEEMINDRMEDGLSEEEAISGIGSIDEIYAQISQDSQKSHLTFDKTKQKTKSKRKNKAIILASTAVIWAPILIVLIASAIAVAISVVAVAFSLYAVLWSLVVTVWAIFVSSALSAPVGALIGLLNIFSGNVAFGFMLISCGMVLAGLAIFAFFGALYATKGSVILTKKFICAIKKVCYKIGNLL